MRLWFALLLFGAGGCHYAESVGMANFHDNRVASSSALPLQNESVEVEEPASPEVPKLIAPADSALRRFELSADACDPEKLPLPNRCPFVVRLLDRNTEVASLSLDFVPAVAPIRSGPLEMPTGAGDPLEVKSFESSALFLHTGEESSEVSTVVRPVRLAPQISGLLVDQAAGFEHRKRAHFLVFAKGDSINLGRRFEESSGPTWSGTILLPLPDGRDAVLLLAGWVMSDFMDEPDEVDARLWLWDDRSQSVAEVPAREQVRALVYGPVGSVDEARRARAEYSSCLGDGWLLPYARVSLKPVEGIAVAVLGASEPGARARLHEQCGGVAVALGRLR